MNQLRDKQLYVLIFRFFDWRQYDKKTVNFMVVAVNSVMNVISVWYCCSKLLVRLSCETWHCAQNVQCPINEIHCKHTYLLFPFIVVLQHLKAISTFGKKNWHDNIIRSFWLNWFIYWHLAFPTSCECFYNTFPIWFI